MSTIIIETRRSKGTHKADLTQMSKEEIKQVLSYYASNSFVAVKNYRNKATEIKFERMAQKGMTNYCLKTVLTPEDLASIGFVKTEKGNMHLTEKGCTINSRYDIEVKEPVKKISSKKSKAEKKEVEKSEEKATTSKKQPLPFKKDTKVETKVEATEEKEVVATK